MIFSIAGSLDKAEKVLPETFVGLNIWEKRDVQEWVRGYPEMLGENLLILTVEFDQFVNSSNRLDVLAMDHSGNLVVVELKRDSVSAYSDLQAIRYAAMVSSMTIEKLLPYYIAYRKKTYNESISEGEAEQQIRDFVEDDSFKELSTKPRIILCSEGFSQEITTTVLWLRASTIDISCVRITPYRVGAQIIIVPAIIIPLPEAKRYLTEIKIKEEEREQSSHGTRAKTMRILIQNGLVAIGETIYLKKGLPPYVQGHYKENDPMFQAKITGKLGRSDAVQWMKDGSEYSITSLASKVFKHFEPNQKDPPSLNGSLYWTKSDGRSLAEIAADFLAKPATLKLPITYSELASKET